MMVLYQNYPNPFNPTTTISWLLAVNSHVKLDLYNLRGQRINTLLSALLFSGHHSLELDASDLSSGVYWLVFQLGPDRYYQKISYVK
jgi:hypothetical protein